MYLFFYNCHVRNLVWNWYKSMEDCLPFHSWNLPFHFILASSIFHTKISIPFHFLFHSIPCPAACQIYFILFFFISSKQRVYWLTERHIVKKPARNLSLVVTIVPSENARPDQIVDLIKELCNLNCFFTLQAIYDKSKLWENYIALYNLVSVAFFITCLLDIK